MYAERLNVPLRWWVQATMMLATAFLAVVVALPFVWACVVTGALAALVAGLFLAYGTLGGRIEVADDVLRVGRARIGLEHVGTVTPLDAEATRRLAGRDADARAYLLLRPYLKRSVRIQVTDPADPVPYWLVSTRHPRRLAAALTRQAASEA